MPEIIANEISGGDVVVRECADNMYHYLPVAIRAKREAGLIAAARAAFPWLPKKLAVQVEMARDYHHYLTVRYAVPDAVRVRACEARIKAATLVRCACGSMGVWSASVVGTTDCGAAVWAGCPNCSGTAIGRPIRRGDLEWYERTTKQSVIG